MSWIEIVLIVAAGWWAILLFLLLMKLAGRPDGGCLDGKYHDWEWDPRDVGPGHEDNRPWRCVRCSDRTNSNGVGGFGP